MQESSEAKVGYSINVLPLVVIGLLLSVFVGSVFYGLASDPEFVETTGIARCEAVKETIDEEGIYWSDLDEARERLNQYKNQIESACPAEFAQLEKELTNDFQNDCDTNRWSATEEIAKAMVECGVNEKDHLTIMGNAVQMKEGAFFLPTISSVYVETYTYHGVTGYALKVVLRETEKHQYFANRYSNKSDVDADYKKLVSSMAGVTPVELGLASKLD